MAFKVETGTGDDASTSFASVLDFINYWAARGSDLSDLDGEAVQAALTKATDYMELRFASKWKGTRVYAEQALSWPRKRVYSREGIEIANDIVPMLVKKACMEYAKRALDADLLPDPGEDPNVVSKTETIGPISTTITYKGSSQGQLIQSYPSADKLLIDLLGPSGGTIR